MTPERWRRIEELYHRAREQPAGMRRAFLEAACAGEGELRSEVEALLDSRADNGFLSRPPMAVAAAMISRSGQTLVGLRLGVFEIRSLLGAGGMGEVYRARDTRLGRDVAIKILPRAFATEPARLARFDREARVLATLNHPNIAAIYGVQDTDDVPALVLELVEGQTLAERLAGRSGKKAPHTGLSVDEAMAIARQIADALDVAHERGIVHRDLKPANIKITPEGVVKVLDFGLAKAVAGDPSGELSQLPSVTNVPTGEGVILGTPAYMSPEQARGLPVDKRTDIWAFGCVLYEMLTGRPPFRGETVSDTLAAILEREPDFERLPAATPLHIRRILQRCLEKDSRRRLRDIADARIELEDPGSQQTPLPSAPRRPHWTWIASAVNVRAAVVGLVGLVAVAATWALQGHRPSSLQTAQTAGRVRFAFLFNDMMAGGGVPEPSPEGRRFVVALTDSLGRQALWTRSLDSDDAQRLPGTEDGSEPFWSGDGRSIGFHAQGKLKRVSLSGGNPQSISEIADLAQGATWNGSGDIIFAPNNRGGLFHVRDSGGPSKPLTQLDRSRTENSHRRPQFLPDGRHFIFVARCNLRENNALYLGSLDSGETTRIMPVQSNVRYVARSDGGAALLFVRDRTLIMQPFDGSRVAGPSIPVVDNVSYNAPGASGAFSASMTGGVLVFRPDAGGTTRLAWFDRNGNAVANLGPPGTYGQPRVSPDGKRVVFNRPDDESGNRDLWYMETDRGVAQRLTASPANDWHAIWSPDGHKLLFGSDRPAEGRRGPYEKSSMEPGSAEELWFGPGDDILANPSDWSNDGQWVALHVGGGTSLWVSSTLPPRKAFTFLHTAFVTLHPRFSPDGRWLAYTSNETGRYEVYVRPFRGRAAESDGKIRVSTDGGDFPVWGRNGELFFMSGGRKLYAVKTGDLEKTGAAATPSPLFTVCPGELPVSLPLKGASFGHPYDVSPDGQRFLVNCSLDAQARFTVILNWGETK